MRKHNHDALMAEARGLTVESPRDDVRRVRLALADEANRLERAVAGQLRNVREAAPHQKLAEQVRAGKVAPTDPRLKGADQLATRLRAAEVELGRVVALGNEIDELARRRESFGLYGKDGPQARLRAKGIITP
jgi:hypothetical protein